MEQGEGHHRISKARTARISWRNPEKELAGIERRESHLRDIQASLLSEGQPPAAAASTQTPRDARRTIVSQVSSKPVSTDDHHYIARSTKTFFHIPHFLKSHIGDPAATVRSFKDAFTLLC